jgi:hypothetical protein
MTQTSFLASVRNRRRAARRFDFSSLRAELLIIPEGWGDMYDILRISPWTF